MRKTDTIEWVGPDSSPNTEDKEHVMLYDDRFIRVLVNDEAGFIREAFYDTTDPAYYAVVLGRDFSLVRFPMIPKKWAYLPEPE